MPLFWMWITLAMPIFWGTGEVESRASLQAEEREVHVVFLPQYNNVACRLLCCHDSGAQSSHGYPYSPFKPALTNASSWLTLLLLVSNVCGQTTSFCVMVSFVNQSTARLLFLCLTNLTSPPIGLYASNGYASGDGFHFLTNKVYWDLQMKLNISIDELDTSSCYQGVLKIEISSTFSKKF